MEQIEQFLSSLNPEQRNKAERICNLFSSGSMNAQQAFAELNSLGINPDRLKSALPKQKPKISERYPVNALCFCESGKKYKKCCMPK